MEVLRQPNLPEELRGGVYAIGNFDGLHRGHQAVIFESGRVAGELGVAHGLLTFEPHPRSYFRPGGPAFRLTSLARKSAVLESWGVDRIIAIPFDAALAGTLAQDFVLDVLVKGLGLRHAVVGYDFTFGQHRRGNAAMLNQMAEMEGFGVSIVEAAVEPGGETYSSSAIRRALREGRPRDAARGLGRWWCVEGTVRRGEARGAKLGFPTANLELGDYLEPALGVYAVKAALESGGPWFRGVANLGHRPTFGGGGVLLEVHLLDFEGDLYGKELQVEFVDYLRPEKKFDGLDSLKAQIAADCEAARQVLAKSLPPRGDGGPARSEDHALPAGS